MAAALCRKLLCTGCLVLRHGGIDFCRPCKDSTSKVLDVFEAIRLEEFHGLGAARATAAVNNDFTIGVELVETGRKRIQWNKHAAKIALLVFVGLADIENKRPLAGITPGFQIFYVNDRNAQNCLLTVRVIFIL